MEGYLALIKEQREENDKLQQEIERLKSQLQQKENIIKEVREYIKSNEKEYGSLEDNEKIILRILEKEVN